MGRLITTCALLLLMGGGLHAAELSRGEKDTIFIGDLKVQPAVVEMAEKDGRAAELKLLYQSLDTQFISTLNATRVFSLVERKRKWDLELEQSFAAVAVNPDDRNLAKTGMMAGAKFAFLPQIDAFQDKQIITEHPAIGRVSVTREILLSAVVQIVDTTTGKILPDSPSVHLTKKRELRSVRREEAVMDVADLVELAKVVARRLAQESVAYLRPAKVLAVTGKQVMINRGSEYGFAMGDLVDIFAVQNVKDEESGETFRNEIPVGQGIIVRVDKQQSYAKITGEDLGIVKGCVVRFTKSAADRAKEGNPEPDPTRPDFERQKDAPLGPDTGSSDKPIRWK